jgi:hypothetical protein
MDKQFIMDCLKTLSISFLIFLVSFAVSVMVHEMYHIFQITLKGGDIRGVCFLGYTSNGKNNLWDRRLTFGWVVSDTEVTEWDALLVQSIVLISLAVFLTKHYLTNLT